MQLNPRQHCQVGQARRSLRSSINRKFIPNFIPKSVSTEIIPDFVNAYMTSICAPPVIDMNATPDQIIHCIESLIIPTANVQSDILTNLREMSKDIDIEPIQGTLMYLMSHDKYDEAQNLFNDFKEFMHYKSLIAHQVNQMVDAVRFTIDINDRDNISV